MLFNKNIATLAAKNIMEPGQITMGSGEDLSPSNDYNNNNNYEAWTHAVEQKYGVKQVRPRKIASTSNLVIKHKKWNNSLLNYKDARLKYTLYNKNLNIDDYLDPMGLARVGVCKQNPYITPREAKRGRLKPSRLAKSSCKIAKGKNLTGVAVIASDLRKYPTYAQRAGANLNICNLSYRDMLMIMSCRLSSEPIFYMTDKDLRDFRALCTVTGFDRLELAKHTVLVRNAFNGLTECDCRRCRAEPDGMKMDVSHAHSTSSSRDTYFGGSPGDLTNLDIALSLVLKMYGNNHLNMIYTQLQESRVHTVSLSKIEPPDGCHLRRKGKLKKRKMPARYAEMFEDEDSDSDCSDEDDKPVLPRFIRRWPKPKQTYKGGYPTFAPDLVPLMFEDLDNEIYPVAPDKRSAYIKH